MTLYLHNTLTRKKDEFKPIDAKNVRMYVCGPTVYDRPHLGNARSVVVYDVLYRLLCHLYGKEHVTYVRNVTDVDDKINAAAKANKEPISALTGRVEGWFHDDMKALNVLVPSREPHATQHIKQMIQMIEKLIANGYAYLSEGHVLFNVGELEFHPPMPDYHYGELSGRETKNLNAGARVAIEKYKPLNPGDFVLWKPAEAGDDASSVFDSPWGKGRPGWHIECSAMSTEYLGQDFDIHGGGADLMFPHHENEIAQSRCALPDSHFANYWVHNGFLTVNGEKMSKSLGNFITVKDLLDKGVKGEVIRLALLSSKYNEPLDWNEKLVEDAKTALDKWYRTLYMSTVAEGLQPGGFAAYNAPTKEFLEALMDDLNIPKAFSIMHKTPDRLRAMGNLLGILQQPPEQWFKGAGDDQAIVEQINSRIAAKQAKNFAEADRIRKALADQGIILEDRPDGTTDWRRA